MSVLTSAAQTTDTLAALAGGDGLAGAINALDDAIALRATLASPTFTGTVTAPTITLTEGTTSANALNFGSDTNLYRDGAGALKTDGQLTVDSTFIGVGLIRSFTTGTDGGLQFGDSAGGYDTNLYRSAANILKTDDTLEVNVALRIATSTTTASAGLSLKVGTSANEGIAFGTDTTLYRSATNTLKTDDNFIIGGTPTSTAGSAVTADGTQTLTAKRITARITTIVSNATPTVNTDNCDAVTITAQGEAITSMTTNLSGTETNFQKLIYRILDDGTGRAITWGAAFEARGVDLPTTTTASKLLTVGFIYDTVDNIWGAVGVVEES